VTGAMFANPIQGLRLSNDPTESFIDVKVHPNIMGSPTNLSRLQWTLASAVDAEEVWLHPVPGSGYDIRMLVETVYGHWTVERLNKEVEAHQAGGCWVHTVRLSTTKDMVVNVVIEPELPLDLGSRKLAGYHEVAVCRLDGVMNAVVAREGEVYDGLLMQLFVPQIGLSVTLEELEQRIRHLMTSEFEPSDS
jgi:hypothetical protein